MNNLMLTFHGFRMTWGQGRAQHENFQSWAMIDIQYRLSERGRAFLRYCARFHAKHRSYLWNKGDVWEINIDEAKRAYTQVYSPKISIRHGELSFSSSAVLPVDCSASGALSARQCSQKPLTRFVARYFFFATLKIVQFPFPRSVMVHWRCLIQIFAYMKMGKSYSTMIAPILILSGQGIPVRERMDNHSIQSTDSILPVGIHIWKTRRCTLDEPPSIFFIFVL